MSCTRCKFETVAAFSLLAWQVVVQIGSALVYLNRDQGLLHCDVKSANILVFDDVKKFKLCDFGLLMELDPLTKAAEGMYIGKFTFPAFPFLSAVRFSLNVYHTCCRYDWLCCPRSRLLHCTGSDEIRIVFSGNGGL